MSYSLQIKEVETKILLRSIPQLLFRMVPSENNINHCLHKNFASIAITAAAPCSGRKGRHKGRVCEDILQWLVGM